MANTEHYSSLHEFTEDVSPGRNKPFPLSMQGIQGVKRGAVCLRGQTAFVLLIALLASLCVNIVLGVLLFNSSRPTGAVQVFDAEARSLSLKLSATQERFLRLCRDYTTLGATCSTPVRKCRPCPEGWLYIEDKCYHFSEDKLDWQRSRDSCMTMGGHLTILHTHKQHDALEKEARELEGFDYHFWIGLTDSETKGIWKWVDNTTVNKAYWGETNTNRDGQDCAVLDSRAKNWHNVPCNHIYKRICEMDPIAIN